jgi:hypothetical protein
MPEPKNSFADELKALTAAVEKLHGAKASFIGSVSVDEQFRGATVWRGLVSKFELHGHPSATICYAWSVLSDNEHGQRFYAVLHTAQVDSPEKAVRASIVADSYAKTK